MSEQLWSWVLTAIGLTGFYLVAQKYWWAWYVNLANQILWISYSVITEQWGFLAGALAYTTLFSRNAIKWTREHRREKFLAKMSKPVGKILDISEDKTGITAHFRIDDEQFLEQIQRAKDGVSDLTGKFQDPKEK